MGKPIIHESVANVLNEIGVKRVSATNKPNNARFVAEGVDAVLSKYRSKPVKEEDEKGDETDGEQDSTTTVKNDATGTAVKNTPADTEVKVEGEMPDFIKDKIEAKKAGKDGEKKDGDKDEDKSEKKDEKSDDKKDEDKKEKTDESEKFYASRKAATVFMFFEGSDGKMTAEVHGLTEEELAPFGGKAPAVPPKYAVMAKKDSDFNKGKVGTIALMDAKDPKEQQKILTGGELKAVGWKAPMKGTGKSAPVGGMKDK